MNTPAHQASGQVFLRGDKLLLLFFPNVVQVFLAHLSAENNRPELARETVATILARQGIDVPLAVASQEQPVRLHC